MRTISTAPQRNRQGRPRITAGVTTERGLRHLAKANGYGIRKRGDLYSIVNLRRNAIMYYYKDVPLQNCVAFFDA